MKIKRIFVYAEDAPVKGDVVALGMSRAGPPLLRSIIDHIDSIAVFPKHIRHQRQDLDAELAPLCHIVPGFITVACKVLQRIGLTSIADRLSALFVIRMARKSSADIVFSYTGTDVRMLSRTARLARLSGKSYVLYIVDDFIAPLHVTGADGETIDRAEMEAGTALRGARHIFTITNGLGDQLQKRFGVTATTLPLAFDLHTALSSPLKMQIIYVGSINFLYIAGLLDLFKVVEQVRQSSGLDIKVRLTTTAQMAQRQLGELPSFVVAAPEPTAEGLAHEIASSLFAFLPYSFGVQEKAMVTTSFPSKSLEYLAYARSIVVYGPEYGVATQYFRAAGLPSIVSSPAELEEALHGHIRSSPDFSGLYRQYLKTFHSTLAVRETLCTSLDLRPAMASEIDT